MSHRLRTIVVMIAFHGRLLNGAAHSLDLTAGPGTFGFGKAMVDVILRACQLESNECARKGCFFSSMASISAGLHGLPVGSMNCTQLSVSTVWRDREVVA